MRLLPEDHLQNARRSQPSNDQPSHRGRNRLALMGCVLLVLSGLLGGTAVSRLTPDLGQMTFVGAVALFVAAMLTLAFGMIGDARRRR